MVLNRLLLGALLVTAACNQSLFDNGGGDDTTGDDGPGDGGMDMVVEVPVTCPTPCLGDAAGDYNGTATGSSQRWRYLDDNRNRTWTPMTPGATATGNGSNKITTCAPGTSTPACAELPEALLVSTNGDVGAADPALEYTVESNAVVQISLRAFVPADGRTQTLRLYRGSREDALATIELTPGSLAEHGIVLDMLAGERFLLAVTGSAGVNDVGIEMFVSESSGTFPTQCQLSLDFEPSSITGTTVANKCVSGSTLASWDDDIDPSAQVAPAIVGGPYAEIGDAIDLPVGRRLDSALTFDRSGDWTIQFWLQFDTQPTSAAALAFTDIDCDVMPGGIAIDIDTDVVPKLFTESCSDINTPIGESAALANPTNWHFIRVVQQGTAVKTCVDGAKLTEFVVPVGAAHTSYSFAVARHIAYSPRFSYFDGKVDDMRVLKGTALPCD